MLLGLGPTIPDLPASPDAIDERTVDGLRAILTEAREQALRTGPARDAARDSARDVLARCDAVLELLQARVNSSVRVADLDGMRRFSDLKTALYDAVRSARTDLGLAAAAGATALGAAPTASAAPNDAQPRATAALPAPFSVRVATAPDRAGARTGATADAELDDDEATRLVDAVLGPAREVESPAPAARFATDRSSPVLAHDRLTPTRPRRRSGPAASSVAARPSGAWLGGVVAVAVLGAAVLWLARAGAPTTEATSAPVRGAVAAPATPPPVVTAIAFERRGRSLVARPRPRGAGSVRFRYRWTVDGVVQQTPGASQTISDAVRRVELAVTPVGADGTEGSPITARWSPSPPLNLPLSGTVR